MNRIASLLLRRLPSPLLVNAIITHGLLLISSVASTAGPGPHFFGVFKGEQLIQTNAGPAVADSPTNLVFEAFNDGEDSPGFLLFAPGDVAVPMNTSEDPSGREYRRSYGSLGAMAMSFPNGVYTMVLSTEAGPRTNELSLTGDLYPAAVVLNNFNAAQAIDPASGFVVSWDPIAGGTTNDFIRIEITDCQGGRVLETPPPGTPTALNGTSTSLSIPARRLRPGQRYGIELMAVRFSTYDTNSQPGAVGMAGYYRRTRSWLTTTGTPAGCPVGQFELMFQYPFFELGTSTQGVVSFPQGLGFYVANFSVDGRQDTNFPGQVRFTGPGGFGWSNETNHSGHIDSMFAWYASRFVTVPPFPPGGLYAVDYKGSNQVFNLLDPNAAHQQTLLIPTAIVDPTGLLTELRWAYFNTNGTPTGPQSYMSDIVIRLEGTTGNLYDPMNHGLEIPPSASAHPLAQPVPWSNVRIITIGFRDPAGNRFVSHWNRSPGSGPQILTAELPPGAVGVPYRFTLSAQGSPPLRYGLANDTRLPASLQLNPDTGAITGTPSVPGEFALDFRVTDAQSNAVTRNLVLRIEGGGGGPEVGTEPNLRELLLMKGLDFVQTNSAGATPAGPSNALFRASVSFDGPSSVTNGLLRSPNGSATPFAGPGESGDAEAAVERRFTSTAALDAAFPNGRYDFVLDTVNAGPLTNSLSIAGNLYPSTPRISNFGPAQTVNPTNDFMLTWDALAGATTNDLILVEVRDCRDREVFRTPGPDEPGALGGTATGALIPGRTLQPGHVYSASLLVARIVADDPTVPPTGRRRAAYVKQLGFKMSTQGPPQDCAFGNLRLMFTFRAGVFNGTSGFTTYPQDIAFYTAHFDMDRPEHPPETVTFSGPPGSGLNNAPAAHRGSDAQHAWFSSINVNTPPFPPGGIYAVQLDDAIHPHTILNPNVAGQKILLVPGIATNSTGGITAIHWTYRDGSGSPVNPVPPFIRQVHLRLNGVSGPLLDLGGRDGEGPAPSATNVVIDPPVPWSSVIGMQTGFTDPAGNSFLADWFHGSSAIQITTFALPGGVISNGYQGFLTAFGGTPPRTWSITSGSLPSGLTLNPDTGGISGIPIENGAFGFSARVVDANADAAEREFVIFIKPPGPDASTYLVAKGRRFLQTNAAPPSPAEPGFQFVSFVEARNPGAIQRATLEIPGGLVRTLTQDFDRFRLEELFETQTALDAAFANGIYTFSIVTEHEGTASPSLLLTNNAYPTAPRVANWSAAQGFDAGQHFIVAWDPFPGGGTNDLILLGVANESDEELFSTPGFLEPGHLDGTRTNAVIPAGTLEPGAPHKARLLFVRRSALDTNSYPGTPGFAAFFAETVFPIRTANPAGTIQFGAPVFVVNEAAGALRIPVLRLGGTEGNVAVEITVAGGSADPESDFAIGSAVLQFPDGVSSNAFTIEIHNDESPEPPESIHLALTHAEGGAGLGALRETAVTIDDDDRPAGASVDFYIVAKGQAHRQTGPGTPIPEPGEPFFFGSFARAAYPGGLNAASMTGPAGTTNRLSDEDGDGRHFDFFTTFEAKAALDAAFGRGVYTFRLDTVTDGIRTPAMTLGADAYPGIPHVSNWPAAQAINAFADFTLSWDLMTGGTPDDFVRVSIMDTNSFETVFETPDLLEDGALHGGSTAVVIPGGTLEPGRAYFCELLFFNATVINGQAYPGAKGIGGYARQTRTILTTATPPPVGGQIQFASATFNAPESNANAIVTLVRHGGSQGNVSVTVSATNGTATAGADFTATSVVVSFVDGETNATFELPILDDSTFEGPESVRLGLRSVTGGAALAGQTNAILTILDNELPPAPGTLQFSVANVAASEGAGTVTLTVTRTGGSGGEVTVEYETADGTATSGDDYAGDSGTVVFGPGVTTRTIIIELVPDAFDESNEVFRVTLANPSNGATLGERDAATITITDDDVAGVISFAAAEYRETEDGGEAVITVRRTGGTAEGVTVDYAAEGDTAREDVDFEATSGTLEFSAGETEKTFVIPIYDDELPEGNEVLQLVLTNPTGGVSLGRITNAPLTILDNEVVLEFTRVAYTNSEAVAQVVLTVARTGPLTAPVSVEYATGDITATADEDYTDSSGTLTIPAGAASKTFTIPIRNDSLVEDDESFVVTLSNPTGAQLGDATIATVHIIDNDFGGAIAFSAATYNAKENNPVANLIVTRTGGRAGGVTVDFTVVDGSAEGGDDYVATNGTLTFAEGVTRLTIPVALIDDALDESTETFTVQLSNATGGAELGENDEATVNIADNDVAGTIRFGAATFTASETGRVATITLLRSGGKAGGVAVGVSTAPGTAVPDDDYAETNGTVTFGENETSKTFQIALVADGVADGNKSVLLSLSNPEGGARLLTPTNATLNIIDDVSSVQFSSATYTVGESGRSVLLTVERSGPPGTVSVTYTTADGTAMTPGDYRSRTGVLTFTGTVTTRTIAIPIVNDASPEENEGFTVTLSNPSAGTQLGTRQTATVTIIDNDVAARQANTKRRR